MTHVKTAISLEKELFERLDSLADEMQVSRSRLFALALEDYLRRQQNRGLLEQINAAYADAPDPAEERLQRHMRQQHRQLLEDPW